MKYLILLITILQVSTCFAQKPYKKYFDKDGRKTTQESAYYYEEGRKMNGKYFGEIVQYFIKDKTVKQISNYDLNGKQGSNKLFYENGHMKINANYVDGLRNGNYQSWHQSGKEKEVRNYIKISKDFDETVQLNYLIINSWDSIGNKQVIDGNGYFIGLKKESLVEEGQFDHLSEEYYSQIEGEVNKGKRIGKWKGTKADGSSFEETYKNGKLIEGEITQASGLKFKYNQTFEQPIPKNGYQGFYKFIGQNMKYPNDARRYGYEGKVFVQFVVDKEGKLTKVKTIKGIAHSCDREAERVVKKAKAWKPGYLRGVPVKVRYILPLTFKLS